MVELGVPVAPVLSHQEILVDPQLTHNGAVLEATHPIYGRYRRVRPAARLSETSTKTTPPAVLYAENTGEILDELGVSEARRSELRASGVIR